MAVLKSYLHQLVTEPGTCVHPYTRVGMSEGTSVGSTHESMRCVCVRGSCV